MSNVDALGGAGALRQRLPQAGADDDASCTLERMFPVGGGTAPAAAAAAAAATAVNAIYFSCGEARPPPWPPGTVVDVAFSPQVNDYRGERTVQMNSAGHPAVLLRPLRPGGFAGYRALTARPAGARSWCPAAVARAEHRLGARVAVPGRQQAGRTAAGDPPCACAGRLSAGRNQPCARGACC